jgi:signal transduction histidine kinase
MGRRSSRACGAAIPAAGGRGDDPRYRHRHPRGGSKHIFEQFFRGSNAVNQAIQGTGIGLTIVRSIIANHHGTMDLQTREAEGTTVVIRLPLRKLA